MAINNRTDLINYCLRSLGEPFLQINVAPEQLEDKVDDALQLYQEFHDDATRRNYYEYQIVDSDVTNGYITIPDAILYVVRMFPSGNSLIYSHNMFSFQYQYAMSDFNSLAWGNGNAGGTGGLSEYYQVKQFMDLLDMTLNGTPQITFSRKMNRIYIWGDFVDEDIKAGDYICLEVYETIDPEAYTKIYSDMFMKDYTTALIKRQWGQNMSKYEGVQLPGGVTVNGQQMKEEGMAEMTEARERLRSEQEKPIDFFVG